MTTATSSAADLPLFFLHPVADSHHGWAALLLATPAPVDGETLARLFGEFGLFDALGALPCIVPVADPDQLQESGKLLPAEQIVLKLPGDQCSRPEHCASLARLRGLGFRLMAEGLPPAGHEFCPDINAVALPCPGTAMVPGVNFLAKRTGQHLAVGVDAPQGFVRARDAGFLWFAGNYPLHPDGADLPHGTIRHALLLQLLTLIARDADSHEIEAVIKQDAHLSYQLLKLVNSVAFSLSTKITSFSQAITLLGRRQLQRWLQLLLYARPEAGGRSPLMPRAALRGGLMEALSTEAAGREVHDRAFMVGVFSLLDLLLGMNMGDIVGPLNLAEDVAAALLERTGPFGPLLSVVEAAETGNAAALGAALATAGLDASAWASALVKAYHWAISVSLEA